MTPNSAKEIVLEAYPQAIAMHDNAVKQAGQRAAIQSGRWSVYAADGVGQPLLGEGATEDGAWVKASDKALKRLRTPDSIVINESHVDDLGSNPETQQMFEEIVVPALERNQRVFVEMHDGSTRVLVRDQAGRYGIRPK